MENIRIKVSTKAFDFKPNVEQLAFITNDMKRFNNSSYVSYKELSELIAKGHSVLLAEYKRGATDIFENNIESISCIALDIDSKENKITMWEMISLIHEKFSIYPVIQYCTFSDEDFSRFRLIYRLVDKIDVETYKTLYRALQWKLNKYIDGATKNANRIWCGTNKYCAYIENDKPITFQLIVKLINAYNSKVARDNKKKQVVLKKEYQFYSDNDYIKPDHKEEVANMIINSIDLKGFIQKHFGGNFKRVNGNYVGSCVLHGGDNKNALVISDKIYTCFTHCGTGNIYTVARQAYGINNFSEVSFLLAKEYGLSIPKEYIRGV